MGANSILGKGTDLDNARAERQNRMNPPDCEPAQGDDLFDDDFFDDDLFGSDSSGDTQPASMDMGLGGGGLGIPPLGNSMGLGMGTPSQTTPQSDTEDKLLNLLAIGGKGLIAFFKDLTSSFKGLTHKFWSTWGSNTFVTGLCIALAGLILTIFKVKGFGLSLFVGGFVSAGIGAFVLMLNVNKPDKTPEPTPEPTPPSQDFGTSNEDDLFGDYDEGEDDDGFGDYDEGEDEDDGYGDYDDYDDEDADIEDSDDDFDFDNEDSDIFNSANEVEQTAIDIDSAMDNMIVPDNGMFTRQYLYEIYTRVLANMTADFATVKKVDEESDVFIQWEVFLRDACSATGIRDDALPDLISLEENLFTIKLTFSRPLGLKPDAVANELASIYSYSDGEFNPKIYAKADVVGKQCILTIFTGESAMITLKDTYNSCKDFVLDTKNYMPIVIGVNPYGKVISTDFKNVESILITGMPRKGKSWVTTLILSQMCAYIPPSELNIYICDPKDGISDYSDFKLPHVKKFVTTDTGIVQTLRDVVKITAPKRKKILGDAGYKNIWDYKKDNPTVHMPIIYLLIDEVVTLAERMDKEVKSEFQGLLKELISQLPALGIRAILVPHVIKNDIIAKTATDLIPCRISVCGDAEHIESCLGTKPKDFTYKLSNLGDMAVKMTTISPKTMFIHAAVLADSNLTNKKIFEYQMKFWAKLEPEEVRNAVCVDYETTEQNQKALDNLNLDEDLDLIDFEPSTRGTLAEGTSEDDDLDSFDF